MIVLRYTGTGKPPCKPAFYLLFKDILHKPYLRCMILHGNTLLSEDILEKNFICNLEKCKGACCIEGDSGAPLTEEEITLIEKDLEHIKPYLTPKSRKAIEKKGYWEKDKKDGELQTTCLPTGECNFAIYDENGILGCGIEKAWKEGKTKFRKPISCHLYPIRLKTVGEYTGLNYHKWSICKPACKLGDAHQVPVYKFLKDALIRRFGKKWYRELEEIGEEYKKAK